MVFLRIDAVGNDADTVLGNAVQVMHVPAHGFGNGDHSVRILVGRALQPGGGMIGRAQLFHLPWTMRLQGMGGEHQGRAEQLLQDAAGEMGIPGMAMHDVRGGCRAGHHDVAGQGVHQFRELGILRRQGEVRLDPARGKVRLRGSSGRRNRGYRRGFGCPERRTGPWRDIPRGRRRRRRRREGIRWTAE